MGKHEPHLPLIFHSLTFSSFDNSGQRMSFPHWHSNATNVQRTDNVIKQIASLFATNTNVVPIIAPLNE